MDRPTLNPTIFDDPDRRPEPLPREPWHLGRHVGQLVSALGAGVRAAWRLLWTPLVPRRIQPILDRTPLSMRIVSALVVRVTVLLLLVLATVVGIVRFMTHPLATTAHEPPYAYGVFIQPLTLTTSDGIELEAYLAPALDEAQVLRHGEKAVRAKWPAVLLVPDQRGTGREFNKLIRTLHERAHVVMLLHLRGTGQLDHAQTFGLLERHDIAAAVAHLRSVQYVDADRITVIAGGTGATAALLARRDDPRLDNLVIHDPPENFAAILDASVRAAWIKPACRWAFEIIHNVDVEEMDRADLLRGAPDALVLTGSPSRSPQRESIVAWLARPADAQDLARGD